MFSPVSISQHGSSRLVSYGVLLNAYLYTVTSQRYVLVAYLVHICNFEGPGNTLLLQCYPNIMTASGCKPHCLLPLTPLIQININNFDIGRKPDCLTASRPLFCHHGRNIRAQQATYACAERQRPYGLRDFRIWNYPFPMRGDNYPVGSQALYSTFTVSTWECTERNCKTIVSLSQLAVCELNSLLLAHGSPLLIPRGGGGWMDCVERAS